jgi:hypothetical protein
MLQCNFLHSYLAPGWRQQAHQNEGIYLPNYMVSHPRQQIHYKCNYTSPISESNDQFQCCNLCSCIQWYSHNTVNNICRVRLEFLKRILHKSKQRTWGEVWGIRMVWAPQNPSLHQTCKYQQQCGEVMSWGNILHTPVVVVSYNT